MQNSNNQIFFNFSYFALKLLGKGLYSNHWTAIAELVANGLDAKATNVKILIDLTDKQAATIEIFDNGYGMGYNDLAEKYVLIGKNKRTDLSLDEETKNAVMGRKGIGKLAALYLSNKFYLLSKTTKEESSWCLDMTNINDSDIPHLNRINSKEIKIKAINEWNKFKTGTMIKLMNVDLTNFGEKTLEGLKARLADFYLLDYLKAKIEVAILESENSNIKFSTAKKSIAFKNMCAFFNNTDNDYQRNLNSAVYIKSYIPDIDRKRRAVKVLDESSYETSGKRKFTKENGEKTANEMEYSLKGWMGIHTSINKPDAIKNDADYLKNKAYRPNQLRLYVRNKLAVENFLDYVKNTQAFSNYIEGEISFDILDDNELGDIATSNRQGFTEDDERIKLLIEILKPIINSLITSRINLGQIVKNEEIEYENEQKRLEEEARLKAEKEKLIAEEEKKKAEQKAVELTEELSKTSFNLGSEKKRNTFLISSLSEEQFDFAKRLHMLKTNTGTIKSAITKLVMKKERGRFTIEEAWNSLKTISYCTERIQAILKYGALANFNTKEERITADIFEFIIEYCDNIISKYDELTVNTKLKGKQSFICEFSPQDIVVILENVQNNSTKHNAKTLTIIMESDGENASINVIDDGDGINRKIIDDIDSLFEFGKGYTKTGTGVGLYHIKDIIENNMNGTVSINSERKNGFELQMRL